MTRNCLNVMRKVAAGKPFEIYDDIGDPSLSLGYVLALGDRDLTPHIDRALQGIDSDYAWHRKNIDSRLTSIFNRKKDIDNGRQLLSDEYRRVRNKLLNNRSAMERGKVLADLTGVGLTGGGAVLGGLAGANIAGKGNRVLGGIAGAGIGAGVGYGSYRIAKYLANQLFA